MNQIFNFRVEELSHLSLRLLNWEALEAIEAIDVSTGLRVESEEIKRNKNMKKLKMTRRLFDNYNE